LDLDQRAGGIGDLGRDELIAVNTATPTERDGDSVAKPSCRAITLSPKIAGR
jgi:hypothetical protein